MSDSQAQAGKGLRHLRTVGGPALEPWHNEYKNASPALAEK
jgi:hypothetical protein